MHETPAVNADCFFLGIKKKNKGVTCRHTFSNTPEKLNVTSLLLCTMKHHSPSPGKGAGMKCGLATNLPLNQLKCPDWNSSSPETQSREKEFQFANAPFPDFPPCVERTGRRAGAGDKSCLSTPGFGAASPEPAWLPHQQSFQSSLQKCQEHPGDWFLNQD